MFDAGGVHFSARPQMSAFVAFSVRTSYREFCPMRNEFSDARRKLGWAKKDFAHFY
jgi:hypothetical protein